MDAVNPTPAQREFLNALMRETSKHARETNRADFSFNRPDSGRYFCAYSTSTKRRGHGETIFCFERTKEGLFMHIPDHVPEPKNLSRPWKRKPEQRVSEILIDEEPNRERQSYLIKLAKDCIDYYYNP
jgi:hypothetical protein